MCVGPLTAFLLFWHPILAASLELYVTTPKFRYIHTYHLHCAEYVHTPLRRHRATVGPRAPPPVFRCRTARSPPRPSKCLGLLCSAPRAPRRYRTSRAWQERSLLAAAADSPRRPPRRHSSCRGGASKQQPRTGQSRRARGGTEKSVQRRASRKQSSRRCRSPCQRTRSIPTGTRR